MPADFSYEGRKGLSSQPLAAPSPSPSVPPLPQPEPTALPYAFESMISARALQPAPPRQAWDKREASGRPFFGDEARLAVLAAVGAAREAAG